MISQRGESFVCGCVLCDVVFIVPQPGGMKRDCISVFSDAIRGRIKSPCRKSIIVSPKCQESR